MMDKLVVEFAPLQVVLFGSQACGITVQADVVPGGSRRRAADCQNRRGRGRRCSYTGGSFSWS